jgi:transposase-like protein
MSRRGRPPKKLKHVDKLEGDESSKERLKVILETLFGALSVEAACRRLGVSEPRFHALRQQVLEAAVKSLEPRPVGRPPKQVSPEQAKVEELEQRNRELLVDLQVARTRTEIALTMPHLLKDVPQAESGKGGAEGGGKRKRRRSGEEKSDT